MFVSRVNLRAHEERVGMSAVEVGVIEVCRDLITSTSSNSKPKVIALNSRRRGAGEKLSRPETGPIQKPAKSHPADQASLANWKRRPPGRATSINSARRSSRVSLYDGAKWPTLAPALTHPIDSERYRQEKSGKRPSGGSARAQTVKSIEQPYPQQPWRQGHNVNRSSVK
jgi:hypothetical protein